MKKIAIGFVSIFLFQLNMGYGQKKIDQAFVFPPGSGFHKYSIYEPSALSSTNPIKMLVGFHPFNTSVWNAKTWRDTLIFLAEENDLLLVCPDGGADGRVDDQSDYDFTEALIDSMLTWYDVDVAQIYAIGFSVGGKAVYEYGLNHRTTFKGFIPIGAAIDGTAFLDGLLHKSKCKNYYLIHGQSDAPGKRFTPIYDSLIQNGAKVNSTLMAGIGHTFNFPGRETILKQAFTYVDTASCDFTGIRVSESGSLQISPTQIEKGGAVFIDIDKNVDLDEIQLEVIDISGKAKSVSFETHSKQVKISTTALNRGINIIKLNTGSKIYTGKVLIY